MRKPRTQPGIIKRESPLLHISQHQQGTPSEPSQGETSPTSRTSHESETRTSLDDDKVKFQGMGKDHFVRQGSMDQDAQQMSRSSSSSSIGSSFTNHMTNMFFGMGSGDVVVESLGSATTHESAPMQQSEMVSNNTTFPPPTHLTSPTDSPQTSPTNPLTSQIHSPLSSQNLSNSQISKFKKILFSTHDTTTQSTSTDSQTRIDLNNLRKISWNGIAEEYRAYIWKLLIGYLPVNVQRQKQALKLKREEYSEMVQKYFYEGKMSRTAAEKEILKQIQKDTPRTHPSNLFQSERIMKSLERLLYIWSIRHPASGYVQGIDNLATPFLLVFLSNELQKPCHETLQLHATSDVVSEEVLNAVECDTFWCMDSFLNFVQDFYTHGHPGIYKVVQRLENIIKKSENQLYQHLNLLQQEGLGLSFSQFGFRWMNCLLMREFDLLLIVRLFDSYIAEGERLAPFVTFLSASLLKQFAAQISRMDYIEAVSFFQEPPTKQWQDVDQLEELLSESFILQNLYENT